MFMEKNGARFKKSPPGPHCCMELLFRPCVGMGQEGHVGGVSKTDRPAAQGLPGVPAQIPEGAGYRSHKASLSAAFSAFGGGLRTGSVCASDCLRFRVEKRAH